jgi:hypothetical protein
MSRSHNAREFHLPKTVERSIKNNGPCFVSIKFEVVTPMTFPYRILVVLSFGASGCGASDDAASRAVMTETQHTHYHVHGVDVSHDHTHQALDEFGGHVHSHEHSNEH